MGLGYVDLRNLIEFRGSLGSRSGAVATLGRQELHLHPVDLRKLKALAGHDTRAQSFFDSYCWGEYVDRFFVEVLEFSRVDSIDLSDYQGATIIHDLSTPLPEKLIGRYDLAVDGGTLEHVFNFPTALANLMRLARIGGAVYSQAPANNHCGHGFYQFSPELFFRVFGPSNGFEAKFVRIAVKHTTHHSVYDVMDPEKLGRRVPLLSKRPTTLMCLSIRTEDRELFKSGIFQSDYSRIWAGGGQGQGSWLQKLSQALAGHVPISIHDYLRALYWRRNNSLRNRAIYRKLWENNR